jgi:hypothetical protein
VPATKNDGIISMIATILVAAVVVVNNALTGFRCFDLSTFVLRILSLN